MTTYRMLDASAILTTCERLSARIDERFPGSGLSKVGRELLELSRESGQRIDEIRKPLWTIRIGAGVVLAIILAIAIGVGATATMPASRIELFSLLQFAETAINDMIFLGVAAFFCSRSKPESSAGGQCARCINSAASPTSSTCIS